MRKITKRILSCAAVLLLTAAMLAKAADVTELKLSRIKFHNFFEHAEEFDVLFIGSSHMVNGVFPLELWHDYGITSFNLGGHGNHIPTTYWEYMNALDYADPDIVVIDCLSLGGMQKTTDRFSMVHRALDAFPLSVTKIKAALDLADDPVTERLIASGAAVDSERRSAFSLLWNFGVFHARWPEVSEEDFNPPLNIEYGAESRVQLAMAAETAENPGTVLEKETLGTRYLKKIVDECEAHGREAVLIYLPYPATTEASWIDANTMEALAEEWDVPCINFLEENVVDFRTDCYDGDSHLNPSGAFKVTDYLGRYLTERCGAADHRGDASLGHWDDDYTLYENEKDARLADIEDLNTYLMLLEDDLYGFAMEMGDLRVLEDETTAALLENKGVDVEEIRVDPTLENEIIVHVFRAGDESAAVDTASFRLYDGINERKSEPTEKSEITVLTSRAVRETEDEEE